MPSVEPRLGDPMVQLIRQLGILQDPIAVRVETVEGFCPSRARRAKAPLTNQERHQTTVPPGMIGTKIGSGAVLTFRHIPRLTRLLQVECPIVMSVVVIGESRCALGVDAGSV